MNWQPPQLNMLLAWGWIIGGFASGALLGLGFLQENWLGGYTSVRRRLYRLAHISFFGLGALNLMFFLTVSQLTVKSAGLLAFASWGFVIGAVTMPICCVIVAHAPKFHTVFVLPVASLLGGAIAAIGLLIKT